MFSLEQLRCFVAVAENLHFGRAAQQLAMTQPPLSRQIQKLEKLVGARLLERDNRRVELTVAGEVFLREARLILSATEKAGHRARMVEQGMAGRIGIGYTAGAGSLLLGEILTTLKARLPDVVVDLYEMVTSEQLAGLEAGQLDIGFGRLDGEIQDFEAVSFRSERLLLAAPEEHDLLVKTTPLLRDDIGDHELLMHSPVKARYLYDLIVRHFPIDHSQVVYQLSQISTMVSLVASGLGLAVVPESAAHHKFPGVGFRGFHDLPHPVAEISMIHRPSSDNPAERRAWQILLDSISDPEPDDTNRVSMDTK